MRNEPSDLGLSSLIELSTAEILASGGDSRQVVNAETRLTKYGCSMEPRVDVAELGSCTASSPSALGFEAAARLHRRLIATHISDDLQAAIDENYENVRAEILFLLTGGQVPGVEVVLTPSGTDVELFALALAGSGGRSVSNVLIGPGEIGTGTPQAAGGMYFDAVVPSGVSRTPNDPVDADLAKSTRVLSVWLRDVDGRNRPEDDLDLEVETIVREQVAEGRIVLLHVVAHSKTGLHAPSLRAVRRICQRHGTSVVVVVDAAQGRISRRGLVAVLQEGYMVLTTGSKFYGGPSFAGALLVPPTAGPQQLGLRSLPSGFADFLTAGHLPTSWMALRADLPPPGNLGLLFRWTAAVAEMREYYATPSALRLRVLRAFEELVPQVLGESTRIVLDPISEPILSDQFERVLQSKTTVFSFALLGSDGRRLGLSELRAINGWLNIDSSELLPNATRTQKRVLTKRIHIGQPVVLGRGVDAEVVVRIALSGVLVAHAAQNPEWGDHFEDRVSRLRDYLVDLRDKIEVLVEYYPMFATDDDIKKSSVDTAA